VEGELSAMARLTGDAQGAALGTTVANLGDVNGDGLNEVVVGVPGGPDVNSFTVAYILQGPYSGENPARLSSRGRFTSTRSYIAYEVANAGDHTGDGVNDILVSDADPNGWGGAYLLDGAWNFVGDVEDLAIAHLPDNGPDSVVAYRIFGDFDLDGDSQSDVAVNTYGAPALLQVYTGPLAGELDYNQDVWLSLTGGDEDYFGDQAIFADVDGNGVMDVVTSAPDYITNSQKAGRVYLFRDVGGGSYTADEADTTWYGEGFVQMGLTLDLGEDAAGDGYPDLWVGAWDELAGAGSTSLRRMSLDSPAGLVND
jgi:glycosylphosphatidylinositol phospholipase D